MSLPVCRAASGDTPKRVNVCLAKTSSGGTVSVKGGGRRRMSCCPRCCCGRGGACTKSTHGGRPLAPPATWKYQVYAGWLGHPRKADLDTDEKALEHFRNVLGNQAEPYKSVAEAFKEGTKVPVDEGACFAPSLDLEWNNHGGRLVIAGDAAHSSM